jgi:D-alanyl-D-alanine carboxypeptidase/D-alanyl-D-alanine-endopeptidase (penicillin-binding protein 4)
MIAACALSLLLLGAQQGVGAADVAAAAARLCADPRLADARVGIDVRDLATGEVLASVDADKGFLPASSAKLITAAVALLALGPDFRFTTRLVARGELAGGVLRGDLVLVGAGDPSLGGRHEVDGPLSTLRRAADEALRRGLRSVTGAVLGDDDCFADEGPGDGWSADDEGKAYAAEVSGLCFAENVVRLVLRPTSAGELAALEEQPSVPGLRVRNEVRCARTATAVAAARTRGPDAIVLGGVLGLEGAALPTAVAVPHATAWAAAAMREALLQAGVAVAGPAADRDAHAAPLAPESATLAEVRSPPLDQLLSVLLADSQNLYGEQLLRAAAAGAAMPAAAANAKAMLARLGVDPGGLALADGSGLSRYNLVRPSHLAALLAGMWRSAQRPAFLAALPAAGEGTLRERFSSSPFAKRIRAKTGSMRHVVALSGYALRADQAAPPLAFAVLVNNFTCAAGDVEAAIDGFVEAVALSADTR